MSEKLDHTEQVAIGLALLTFFVMAIAMIAVGFTSYSNGFRKGAIAVQSGCVVVEPNPVRPFKWVVSEKQWELTYLTREQAVSQGWIVSEHKTGQFVR